MNSKKKKMKLRLIFLAGFFLVCFNYCGKQKSYTVEVKDEVRIIHNIQPKHKKSPVELVFNRQIGELEPEDDNYMFASPLSTARDNEGNIYILDTKDYCIKKFSPDGKFINKFGRKGQGPVEFQYPHFIDIDNKNNLYVYEYSTIQIISKDGSFIKKTVLPDVRASFYKTMMNGNSAALVMDPGGENTKENLLFGIFDIEGTVLHKFGEPFLLEAVMESWRANFCRFTVDKKNNIYIAFSNQNRIERYTQEGKLIWKADRPINLELKYETTMVKREIQGRIYEMPEHKFTPVSRGLGFDHKGRLWIMTNKAEYVKDMKWNEFLHFEVFDSDGVLLFYVPLPADLERFDNFDIFNEMIYFNDPFGECCVHEYKIVDL